MNNKGFELAINFIVMLVLAIVVFGFGLYFTKQLFSQAGEIKAQLDQDSEKNINALLDRGERVAFPVANKDIKPGGLAIFGLGVMNVEDNPTKFYVKVKCMAAVTESNKEIANGCKDWGILEVNPFTLSKNEKKVVPIAVQPKGSKPSGTYAFDVNVTKGLAGPIYGGSPKQIYVNII